MCKTLSWYGVRRIREILCHVIIRLILVPPCHHNLQKTYYEWEKNITQVSLSLSLFLNLIWCYKLVVAGQVNYLWKIFDVNRRLLSSMCMYTFFSEWWWIEKHTPGFKMEIFLLSLFFSSSWDFTPAHFDGSNEKNNKYKSSHLLELTCQNL